MVCPNCGKEGIESTDAFCRRCGFALATPTSVAEHAAGVVEKKPVTAVNRDASRGLELLGAAIIVLTAIISFGVATLLGFATFVASVLPWVTGALMMVGLVMIFIGFELRPAH